MAPSQQVEVSPERKCLSLKDEGRVTYSRWRAAPEIQETGGSLLDILVLRTSNRPSPGFLLRLESKVLLEEPVYLFPVAMANGRKRGGGHSPGGQSQSEVSAGPRSVPGCWWLQASLGRLPPISASVFTWLFSVCPCLFPLSSLLQRTCHWIQGHPNPGPHVEIPKRTRKDLFSKKGPRPKL